ncbi:MAG TPA: hypothetical protein VNJ08_05320 [Bacteriovoracaceae bacterium]|nr:hypothetical protein [Bacteriovoracaceae bacterium]
MKSGLLILLFILSSCATKPEAPDRVGRASYAFVDASGKYSFDRENKIVNKRLVSRVTLTDVKSRKLVEKSITVSQIGTIKNKKSRIVTVRPMASEFTVWLEGKKYSSVMRLDTKNKSMTVQVESPDAKVNGTSQVAFPKGSYFCFYSQIPDCLYHNQFLQRSIKKPNEELNFYVVWDAYPFIQEQYNGIGHKLFERAQLKFEGEVKKNLRYMVELEGQAIHYNFSEAFDLVNMSWIAQGITVVPPGEEIPDEEQ